MIVQDLPFGKTIGGHAIASICGYNDYEDSSATDVWEILTGKRESRFKPSLQSEKGHALQPLILKYWAEENSLKYRENISFIDDEYSFISGHLDALIIETHPDYIGEKYEMTHSVSIAEVKTVNFKKARQFGIPGTGEVPKNCAIQCMWYMMLANVESAQLLVYANDATTEYIIYREKEIEAALRSKAIDFWTNHVLADIPPKPTTLHEIGRYYSRSNGLSVDATVEAIRYYTELKELKDNIKQLETRKEKLETSLKSELKENEILQANGAILATWKNSTHSSFDSKAFREMHPDLYDEFLRKQEIRRFLVK